MILCAFTDYEHFPRSCVSGYNIEKFQGKSLSSCKAMCMAKVDCLAFEYGVSNGGSGNFVPEDCILNSSADKKGCDGSYHNLDLYIKKGKQLLVLDYL